MGNIKTKRRNRLTPQRTRDLALIKLDVRRQQAINGTLRKRVKRAFGSFSDPSGSRVEDEEIAQIACARKEDNEDEEDLSTQISSMSDEANEADDGSPLTADVSFRAVAARLAADVAADEDAEDVGELENDESDNVSGRQVQFYTLSCLASSDNPHRFDSSLEKRGSLVLRASSTGVLKQAGSCFGHRERVMLPRSQVSMKV